MKKNIMLQSSNQSKYGIAVSSNQDSSFFSNCCTDSLQKQGLKNWSFFALFEGHDGGFVSEFLSKELLNSILNADQELFNYLVNTHPDMIHNDDKQIANRMKEAINKAILDIDKNMSNLDEIKKFAQNANFPGSTAVACLISPTHIYLINCGDSKAIFVSDNRIKSITREHLVIFSEEKTRIENANGIFGLYDIYYKGCKSNITRSFGDYHFKANLDKTQLEQIITAQPDIHVNKRSANDEFILLASKSVWNTFDTENLKNYIHSKLKTTDNLSKICQEIEYIFFKKVTRFLVNIVDNYFFNYSNKVKDQGMCIILVGLPGSSKIDDAEITKENQFNDKIKNNVESINNFLFFSNF